MPPKKQYTKEELEAMLQDVKIAELKEQEEEATEVQRKKVAEESAELKEKILSAAPTPGNTIIMDPDIKAKLNYVVGRQAWITIVCVVNMLLTVGIYVLWAL